MVINVLYLGIVTKALTNKNLLHKVDLYNIKLYLSRMKIFIPNRPVEYFKLQYEKDWKVSLSKSKDNFIDIINNKLMLAKKKSI